MLTNHVRRYAFVVWMAAAGCGSASAQTPADYPAPPPPPAAPPPGETPAAATAPPAAPTPAASTDAQGGPLPSLPSSAPPNAPPPAAPVYDQAPPAEAPPPASQWVYSYPTGQWVYTANYGWVWVPAGTEASASDGVPYAYLYTPAYGWTWYVSPWGWGPYRYGVWVRRPYWPRGYRGAWVAHPHVIVRFGGHRRGRRW